MVLKTNSSGADTISREATIENVCESSRIEDKGASWGLCMKS